MTNLRNTIWILAALVFVLPQQLSSQGRDGNLRREGERPLPGFNDIKITGEITEEDGTPASNIQVLMEVRNMYSRRPIGRETTRTDPSGRFTFDLRPYQTDKYGIEVITDSPRYMEASDVIRVTRDELPARVDLSVKRGAVARGTVTDQEGNPLEDVLVGAPGIKTRSTDRDGKFEVYGLYPQGHVQLRFTKSGYAEEFLDLQFSGPEMIDDLIVTMRAASNLKGKVVDPKGEPVSGAIVYLALPSERMMQAKTGPAGGFEFQAVPETLAQCRIHAVSQDYLLDPRPFAAEEEESREIVLRMKWPLVLEGRVELPGGGPAGGALVRVMDDGRVASQFFTDHEGKWIGKPFRPGGEMLVVAFPPSTEGRRATGELQVLEETEPGTWTAKIDPWPRGYSSRMTISIDEQKNFRMVRRDSGFGGIPGEVVYEGEWDPAADFIEGTVRAPAIKAEGSFTAEKYARGSASLRGVWDLREEFGPGEIVFAPVMRELDAAPFPGIQHVDLRLAPSGTIRGRVLDEEGKPPITGIVLVTDWNGIQMRDTSAPILAGGAFDLTGLPEGVLKIQAYDENNEQITQPVYLRAGVEGVILQAGKEYQDEMDSLAELRPDPRDEK